MHPCLLAMILIGILTDLWVHFFFMPVPVSQMVAFEKLNNNDHFKIIANEFNNDFNIEISPNATCAYVFHNIRGNLEFKLKNLNYVNYLNAKFNRINFLWFVETKRLNLPKKMINGYQPIFQKAIKTSKGGISNGIIGLISNEDIYKIRILIRKWFFIAIEKPCVKQVHAYAYVSPERDDIFRETLALIVYLANLCNLRDLDLIVTGDFNAKFGRILRNAGWNERGSKLWNLINELDCDIINRLHCDGSVTCGKHQIDISFAFKRTIAKYGFDMKIDRKYGSDHNLLYTKIHPKANMDNKYDTGDIFGKIVKYNANDKGWYYIAHSKLLKCMNYHILSTNLESIITEISDVIVHTKHKFANKDAAIQQYDNIWYEIYIQINEILFESNVLYIKRDNSSKLSHEMNDNDQIGLDSNYARYGKFANCIRSITAEIDRLNDRLVNSNQNNENNAKLCNLLDEYECILMQVLQRCELLNQIKISNKLNYALQNYDSKLYFKVIKDMGNNNLLISSLIDGYIDYRDNINIIEMYNDVRNRFKPKNKCDILYLTYEMIISEYDDLNHKYYNQTKQISMDEIDYFLKTVNKNAAESFDNLSFCFIAKMREMNPQVLLMIFHDIWRMERLNKIAELQLVGVLPKKKENEKRIINIMSIVSKAIESIALQRIENELIDYVGNRQFAYKKKVSINHEIMILYSILAHSEYIYMTTVFLVIIDFAKAYNNVLINVLFTILFWCCGIAGAVFRILYKLCLFNKMVVKCCNVYSTLITRDIGLKEGGKASGILYNIINTTVFELGLNKKCGFTFQRKPAFMKKLEYNNNVKFKQCPWNDLNTELENEICGLKDCIINSVHYADDAALPVMNFFNAQLQLFGLFVSCMIIGAIINASKSSYIIFNKKYQNICERVQNLIPLLYQGKPLKQESDVLILGTIFTCKNKLNPNLTNQINHIKNSALKLTGKIDFAMKLNPMIAKCNFRSFVAATVETSVAVTPWQDKHLNKLNATFFSCFCFACGFSSKTGHVLLSVASGLKNLKYRASCLRLDFFYDLLCLNNNLSIARNVFLHDLIIIKNIVLMRADINACNELKYFPLHKFVAGMFFNELQSLGLDYYFTPALPKLMTKSEWSSLVKNKLNEKWHQKFYTKLCALPEFTLSILIGNDIISDNPNSLYKNDIFNDIATFLKFYDLKYEECYFHPQ